MNQAPQITAIKTNLFFNQTIALQDMIAVSDPDRDDVITRYNFSQQGFGAGSFFIAASADGSQPRIDILDGRTYTISAADLGRVFYTGSFETASETFTVRAFDGEAWSAPSTSFVSTGNTPPNVRAISSAVGINQSILLSQMFTGEDVESDLSFIQIRDNNGLASSGYFVLNGRRLDANRFHQIRNDQISQVVYVGGQRKSSETFSLRASDGTLSSSITTASVVTGNTPSVVRPSGRSLTANGTIDAALLFSTFDADGDRPVSYFINDFSTAVTSGYFELDGRRQAAGTFFNVSAGDLPKLKFFAAEIGRAVDNVGIQVFDGSTFSAIRRFNVVTTGRPVISTGNATVATNGRISARRLFNVTDPDNNPVTRYYLVDRSAGNTGFFRLNGVRQQSGRFFSITADQFANLQYVGGTQSNVEQIGVQVFDGNDFSTITNVNVRTTSAPVVSGRTGSVLSTYTTLVSPLVSYSDADGDAAVRYRLLDRFRSPLSGRFELDGAIIPQSTFFEVTPAEFSRLQFRGGVFGPQSEPILIQAFDGTVWSQQAQFNILTRENANAPDLTVKSFTTRPDSVFDIRSLFNWSDIDGDTIQRVGFYDTGIFANSGSLLIDGVEQTPRQFVEFDYDLALQGRVEFRTASVTSSETYRMYVNDGRRQSVLQSATINVVLPPVLTANDNDISLDTIERRDVSSLFGVASASVDRYQVYDSNTQTRSGRLELDGVDLAQGIIHTLTLAEFGRLQFKGAESDEGRSLDPILIRGVNDSVGSSEWTRINVNTDPVGARSLTTGFQLDKLRGEAPSDATPTIVSYTFIDGGNQAGGTVTNPNVPPLPDYYLTSSPTGGVGEEADGTRALSQPQRESIRTALANFEVYANIQFLEVPYENTASAAQITFGAFDIEPISTLAYAYLPVDGDGRGNVLSDVWFSTEHFDPNDTSLDVSEGSLFYSTVLHEVGHAVGFDHPFEGDDALSIFNNFQYNTIMAYIRDNNFNPFDNGGYPEEASSLQLYDVIELQRLYGTRETFNDDNNQYFFDVAHQQTLYDSGGEDTINFTNHGAQFDETIDLREGQWSTIFGVEQSIRIAYGVNIENARGGAGNDTIIGNETKNIIFGNDGNDILRGNAGNDVLRGGNGNDIYRWSLGDGRDTVFEENSLSGTNQDVLEIYDPSGSLDALEDDLTFRRFGNDFRIDLTLDQGEGQGTVTIKNFADANSQIERLRLHDRSGTRFAEIDLVSIFNQSNTNAQRFQVTTETPLDPALPDGPKLGFATPV